MKTILTFIGGIIIGAFLLWIFTKNDDYRCKWCEGTQTVLEDYFFKTNELLDSLQSKYDWKDSIESYRFAESNKVIEDLVFNGVLNETPIAEERNQISDALRFHVDGGCKTIKDDIKQFVDEKYLKEWCYAY